ANASNANSVALGSSSTTAAYVQTSSATVNGKTYAYAGAPASSSTVSIGAAGSERTLTNLAAGRVSATSTDGINGSQLFQTNAELGNLAANTASALGGGAAAGTAAGGITAPSYTVTTDPNAATTTTVSNVGAALAGLDTAVNKAITFTGTTGTTSQKLGSTVAVIGDSKNISTAVTANQIKVSISDNPSFTSVTTGNTVINNTGITTPQAVIGTGVNTTTLTSTANGLDVGGDKITNVANATAASDAVNKGQLDTAITNVSNAGLDFAGNSGTNVHRNLGQTLDIKGGFAGADTATSNENVKTVTTATGLDIRLAKDAKFDSITAGTGTDKTVLNKDG
ncbi:MAG: hypothetical protein RR575_17240, partial [Acinetobacter sp.]